MASQVRLTSVMPVLRVAELEKSLRFYREVLGFDLAWRAANDGDGENCMLTSSDVSLMLSTGSHLGGAPQLTGTIYFSTVGVALLYGRLEGRVEVAWPLGETEYGTLEFGIRDPDGYTLAFAESREE
jgi:catechol 2,3-dioxygenase-like lactoylglutathione lyase family enzyme